MLEKEEVQSLNKKVFKALDNTSNGEINNDTLFYYFEKDDVVWADYYGGEIVKGHLLGKRVSQNKIEFFYHHINKNADVKIGRCTSEIKIENKKIKLYEEWQWLCDDMSSGTSILVESK